MFFNCRIILFALMCFAQSRTALFAAGPVVYTVRFTLSNQDFLTEGIYTDKNGGRERQRLALITYLKSTQGYLSGEFTIDRNILTYYDGLQIKFGVKNRCLEMIVEGTYEAIKKATSRLQVDIFSAGAKVGLTPIFGSGFISFAFNSKLQENQLLIRNFIVHFYNHPSLDTGALGDDANVAEAFSNRSPEERLRFQQILDEYDFRKRTFGEFISGVYSEVLGNESARSLNLINILNSLSATKQLQIRSMYTHPNAEVAVRMLELIEGSLNYLRALNKPIPFVAKELVSFQDRVNDYKDFVEIAKGDWSRFRPLLPVDWLKGEKNEFNQARVHIPANACTKVGNKTEDVMKPLPVDFTF